MTPVDVLDVVIQIIQDEIRDRERAQRKAGR